MDDTIVLLGIYGPVDSDAVGLGLSLEALQQTIQVGDVVALDVVRQLTELLPLGELLAHAVALLPYEP